VMCDGCYLFFLPAFHAGLVTGVNLTFIVLGQRHLKPL
jgi:hypothetical protein